MLKIKLLQRTDGGLPDHWFINLSSTGRWGIYSAAPIMGDGPRSFDLPEALTEREQRILQSVVDHYSSQFATVTTASALVSSALEQLTPRAALRADQSAYDHGLANGLLMALSVLKGGEFTAVPHPGVYKDELETWAGRYRLARSKGNWPFSAALLALFGARE